VSPPEVSGDAVNAENISRHQPRIAASASSSQQAAGVLTPEPLSLYTLGLSLGARSIEFVLVNLEGW
jgi:hypothetical protein